MYSQVAPSADNISECCTQTEGKPASENLSVGDAQNVNDYDGHLTKFKCIKPPNVSEEKWQKFQQLKERRQDTCKPLSEKTKQKCGRKRNYINDDACTSQSAKKCKGEILKDNKKAWKELCSNIDANVHLRQDSIAKQKPKSKLEEQLDVALKRRNYSEAEKLSDEISRQELGVKIADAIEMREFKKQREEEEKWKKSKTKKKLLWRFEQKEKWESKGNM